MFQNRQTGHAFRPTSLAMKRLPSPFCLAISRDGLDAGRDIKQCREQQQSSGGGEGGDGFLHGLLDHLLCGSIGDPLAMEDSVWER